jgi:hypothetical protein
VNPDLFYILIGIGEDIILGLIDSHSVRSNLSLLEIDVLAGFNVL